MSQPRSHVDGERDLAPVDEGAHHVRWGAGERRQSNAGRYLEHPVEPHAVARSVDRKLQDLRHVGGIAAIAGPALRFAPLASPPSPPSPPPSGRRVEIVAGPSMWPQVRMCGAGGHDATCLEGTAWCDRCTQRPGTFGLTMDPKRKLKGMLARIFSDATAEDAERAELAAYLDSGVLTAAEVREVVEDFVQTTWKITMADGVVTDIEKQRLREIVSVLKLERDGLPAEWAAIVSD
jgi:hypothetical protein